MPFFSQKTYIERIRETYQFIISRDIRVAKVISQWIHETPKHELQRIGEKMHLGRGDYVQVQDHRMYLKSIILMRAAILRHEINKVVSEVKAIRANILLARFNEVRGMCLNPPFALPTALEMANEKRKMQADVFRARHIRGVRSIVPFEIYIPGGNLRDNAVISTRLFITHTLCDGRLKDPILPGQNHGNGPALAGLDGGGELFIIGHGRLGSAIGDSQRHFSARELASHLMSDGLNNNPTGKIIIYLFACWGGTHTRRGFGFAGKRAPYARRFAQALSVLGCNNYEIVAFSGSVSGGDVTQAYDHGLFNRGDIFEDDLHIGEEDAYCIYEVHNGDFNRIKGRDWTTKAGRPKINMRKKFWTSEVHSHLNVYPRGGS